MAAFLAFGFALTAGIAGLVGRGEIAGRASIAICGLLSVSFVILVVAFMRSDFSLALVVANSHSLKPDLYKFAGTWGNHEGSMLLWCLIMAAYGAIAAWVMHPGEIKSKALGVQGLLTALSLAYLLFASSPFTRLDPAPMEGTGLNPLLQDPALAAHPPFLYVGYVGFSFVFSMA
ncbi:MAG: cytochrome c biogenesis protein CcsA, partial [Pseudomonadota bacterium]